MDPHLLYQVANTTAVVGWIALLFSPFAYRASIIIAGTIIPLLFAVAYASLFLAFWPDAEGGFASLSDVMVVFDDPRLVLVGWLHYLAFDLFVGSWEVKTAREENIPFLLVVPCLFLTFIFGPVGFLLFSIIRFTRSRMANAAA